MRTIPSAARTGWLALVLVTIACGGDDAETTTDPTAADDDDGSSSASATNPTDTTADDDGPSTTDDGTTDDGTTAADTTAADTTAADTTAAESSDDGTSSEGGSDESSTGTPLCEPLDAEPIAEVPLSGDGFCEGVPYNVVIEDQLALEAHYAEYCQSAAFCMDPDPPCPELPVVDFASERIIYVFGTGSGCNGYAQINDVAECDDGVVAHYSAGGLGKCDAIVNGWTAALIPLGAKVEFIQE